MPLRLVFFGTPAFAVPSLASLHASAHDVVGVVTQPDRRRGRGQHVAPEAVKRAAEEYGLPLLQPENLKDAAFLSALRSLDADLGVVVAYGRILTAQVLATPKLGLLNVHASILPRWRGAAPVHRAILAGDETTGVTIMRVVQQLDAGPILLTEETTIGPNETSEELSDRLAAIGAELIVRAVGALAAGAVRETAQDEALATYAARLERRESQVDWARPARTIHNQVRGLQPWPMAGATLGDRRVFFVRSEVGPEAPAGSAPGTIVSIPGDALVVAAQPGTIRITGIQPEGRKPMTTRAFLSGHRVTAGDRFVP
jgi:methionyl-tRNA formyltransferase